MDRMSMARSSTRAIVARIPARSNGTDRAAHSCSCVASHSITAAWSDQSGSVRAPNSACTSSDIDGRSPAPDGPAGLVAISVSDTTRPGCSSAASWASPPPIDNPTRCARSIANASSTPIRSSRRSEIV
jgi:hypothetical protein